MSKIDLQPIESFTNEQSFLTRINANNTEVEDKSDTFLSRDGTSPNTMTASLDMNSNRILNLPPGDALTEPVTMAQFEAVTLTAGDAPFSAAYVTLASHANLTNERVLTAGTNVSVTDAGGGSTVTLDLPAALNFTGKTVTAGTFTSPTLTTPAITSGILTTPTVSTSIVPTINDGAPLGTTSLKFSDLFLALGSVINFDSGDVTITHSANALAFAGATSGYSFDNTITPTGGVAAGGGFTASPRNIHTGDDPATVSTDFSDSTPVNTEVYIAEVFVPSNCTVTGVAKFNGSVAAGNCKAGLANSAGAVVATSASTAISGTDAYQLVPFTGTYAAKGPATYYVLYMCDTNTTPRFNTHTIGTFGASKQTGQVFATGFTTITPPTTFTTALGPVASLY